MKRGGVVTVVVQHFQTGEVLMVAYTDEAGYRESLESGEAVYYSTSRKSRWKKGESSGAVQKIRNVLVDCDGDALVYVVEPVLASGTCHTGAPSCFFRSFSGLLRQPGAQVIGQEEELSCITVSLHGSLENVSIGR